VNLQELITKLKGWSLLLRNSPENLALARTTVIGIMLCACAYFAGSTVFLSPLQKELKKVETQKNVLVQSNPEIIDDSLNAAIPDLDRKISSLKDQMALNWIKKKILNEQRLATGNAELFSKTVLTLSKSAPIRMEESIDKVSNVDPIKKGTHTVHPVTVEGNADFMELFAYLRYLENRPEVGMIDALVIESAAQSETQQDRKVHFMMSVGRIDS